jgi:uncharacterized Zn-binding protein involved in type VI secretion
MLTVAGCYPHHDRLGCSKHREWGTVMQNTAKIFGAALALILGTAAAFAQSSPPQGSGVGVITEGSGNVSVGGQAAARQGDRTTAGDAVVEGSPNVFINGRPAVTMGGKTGCGGTTVGGASNVFINGKPVARAGDLTTGCAEK